MRGGTAREGRHEGRRGKGSRAGWFAALFAAAGALATAGPAKADACSECGPPSLSQLKAQLGFTLDERTWGIFSAKDYYEVDGGECRLSLDAAPKVSKRNEWIAAQLSGEAMNCPEGKMVSHIRLALQHTESYDWHLNASISAEIDGPLLAKLKAAVGGETGGGTTEGVIAEINQTIEAAYCHRLRWFAYFIVGDFGATAPWSLERRYAWWTKNTLTGAAVHANGQLWVRCDGGSATMSHWAPLSSHVCLNDRACGNCPQTLPTRAGWFPELPEPLQPWDPTKREGGGDGPIPDEPLLPPELPPTEKPPCPDGKEPVDPNAPPIDPNKPPPPPSPDLTDPYSPAYVNAGPMEKTELDAAAVVPGLRASCA